MQSSGEPLIFIVRRRRFWLVAVPLVALFMAAQIRLSAWAFRVFSPMVDGQLRVMLGFGPWLLAAAALVLLVVVKRVYLHRSFELKGNGLLVRDSRGRQKLLRWENLFVHRDGQAAELRDGQVHYRVHRLLLPELARLCALIEQSHRVKRDSTTLRLPDY